MNKRQSFSAIFNALAPCQWPAKRALSTSLPLCPHRLLTTPSCLALCIVTRQGSSSKKKKLLFHTPTHPGIHTCTHCHKKKEHMANKVAINSRNGCPFNFLLSEFIYWHFWQIFLVLLFLSLSLFSMEHFIMCKLIHFFCLVTYLYLNEYFITFTNIY